MSPPSPSRPNQYHSLRDSNKNKGNQDKTACRFTLRSKDPLLCALTRDTQTQAETETARSFLAKARRAQRGSMNVSERGQRISHGFRGWHRLPFSCPRSRGRRKQKGDSPNVRAAPFIIDVSGKNYFFVMTTLLLPSYVR